jgi:hypothetical protein
MTSQVQTLSEDKALVFWRVQILGGVFSISRKGSFQKRASTTEARRVGERGKEKEEKSLVWIWILLLNCLDDSSFCPLEYLLKLDDTS